MFTRILLFVSLIALLSADAFAHGVLIIDSSKGFCMPMIKSNVDVLVENQVAIVKSTQVFKNNLENSFNIKYGFPLPEGASSVSLRWCLGGVWRIALLSENNDSTLYYGGNGGGAKDSVSNLKKYLGNFPIYYRFPLPIPYDSSITIEVTYVQFLNYEWGNVDFKYPNNYTLISKDTLPENEFHFVLKSQRTIEKLDIQSHSGVSASIRADSAVCLLLTNAKVPDKDITLQYTLSTKELGLFGFSNYYDVAPDSSDRGYFLFVAEPDPSDKTEAMQKVFTLIIDRSGSMSGIKMQQAKNAAKFIVEHLNEGDYFNIIDFESSVYSFKPNPVEFNTANKQLALNYIDGINTMSMTNISGAFQTALNQYDTLGSEQAYGKAPIIMFFTDGMPTIGIVDTDPLLAHIKNLNSNKKVTVYPFGIGSDVNKRLLTLIAEQNDGIADFLDANELEAALTSFYMKIRNPVLIQPSIEFSPDVVKEVYPKNIPNLYKGHQLMVTGRYNEAPDSLIITLKGKAFGKDVRYDYSFNIADTVIGKNNFLGKIWAKTKIDYLITEYHKFSSSADTAKIIKNQVIKLSLQYGIMTEFTAYKDYNDAVPVELVEFNAEVRSNGIILYWVTASENNNYGFYIERRVAGSGELWNQIAFVKGAGTSKTKLYYSFTDKTVAGNNVYEYRLRQIDNKGSESTESTSNIITIAYNSDSAANLEQNAPNPFSAGTEISFTVQDKSPVRIDILDINGNVICNLISSVLDSRSYSVFWDGKSKNGNLVQNGTYICRMVVGTDIKIRKMMLVR